MTRLASRLAKKERAKKWARGHPDNRAEDLSKVRITQAFTCEGCDKRTTDWDIKEVGVGGLSGMERHMRLCSECRKPKNITEIRVRNRFYPKKK